MMLLYRGVSKDEFFKQIIEESIKKFDISYYLYVIKEVPETIKRVPYAALFDYEKQRLKF